MRLLGIVLALALSACATNAPLQSSSTSASQQEDGQIWRTKRTREGLRLVLTDES